MSIAWSDETERTYRRAWCLTTEWRGTVRAETEHVCREIERWLSPPSPTPRVAPPVPHDGAGQPADGEG